MTSSVQKVHFPVGELVLAGVVGEGLHHVAPGAEELPVELLDSLRVFHRGLGGPGPGLDVASLLQLKYKASISNNRASSETLKNVLYRKKNLVIFETNYYRIGYS